MVGLATNVGGNHKFWACPKATIPFIEDSYMILVGPFHRGCHRIAMGPGNVPHPIYQAESRIFEVIF